MNYTMDMMENILGRLIFDVIHFVELVQIRKYLKQKVQKSITHN